MTEIDLDRVAARIDRAKQEVYRMCREGGWRMSIPLSQEHDSDIIIHRALVEAEQVINAFREVLPNPNDERPVAASMQTVPGLPTSSFEAARGAIHPHDVEGAHRG